MVKIYVGIEYSFIRQPIKLALTETLQDRIEFVGVDTMADILILPSGTITSQNKPTILLSDNLANIGELSDVIDICPTPTCKSDLELLVSRVSQLIHKVQ